MVRKLSGYVPGYVPGYVMGIAFFTCVITAALGGTVFAAVKGGPAGAVTGVQKAIEANDMALLERAIDLDAVVAKGVEAALADDAVVEAVSKYPAAALVLALGSSGGANEAIRTLLGSEVKEYIRHGVVSGAFAGKPKDNVSRYGGIFGSKAFRGGDKDIVTISDVTVKNQDKSSARVTATVTQGSKKKTYPVEMAVQKQQSGWRIVEIANIPDLVRQNAKGKK